MMLQRVVHRVPHHDVIQLLMLYASMVVRMYLHFNSMFTHTFTHNAHMVL